MRKSLFIGLTVVCSVIIFYLTFREIELETIASRLSQANIFWVLIAISCTSLAIFLRSLRWKVLLNQRIESDDSFYLVSIGMLMNQVPLRFGDILRGSLATRFKVPFVLGMTTLVVENLIDIAMVIILLAVSVNFLPDISEDAIPLLRLFGSLIVVCSIVFVILIRYSQHMYNVIDKLDRSNRLVRSLDLSKRLSDILYGLQAITSWRSASRVLGLSTLMWIFNIATFYFLTYAFGLQYNNLMLWAALSVVLISLSIAIPISFAGIGPYQVAVLIAGNALAINQVDSLLLGVTVHALSILTFVLWGVIGIKQLNLSTGDMFRKIRSHDKESVDLTTESL